MATGLLVQYGVIALAVLVSAAYVLNRQFPATVRRLRIAGALPLVREGRPSWMRRIGQRIAPAVSAQGGACGGCNSCGPAD